MSDQKGNHNDTSIIPGLLQNYFPVRDTALTRIGDVLGITGTLVPLDANYSIGTQDMPFNNLNLSGTINLSGNTGAFITGPTGAIGFNNDGTVFSTIGLTTPLINISGLSGTQQTNIKMYQMNNILYYFKS